MLKINFSSIFHRMFHFHFDSIGFWFDYKNDEICLIYPWKRNGKNKWISLDFESTFFTFNDIRKMWKDYYDVMENKI
jgi:hypothetical protein